MFSSAEGYVSRISIKHGGFGKALYINHPNGYTTVYAHLKKFNKKIEGKVVIDKNIIGGTKIIVGDSVIDASVRAQLDNLAFTLKA